MYSPIIPRQSSCKPPIAHMETAMLAQPITVFPVKYLIRKYNSIIKLTPKIPKPRAEIKRIGPIDRLVIPSKANASIFFKGYSLFRSGEALAAGILNRIAFITNHRHHTAEEKINLLKFLQAF